MLKIRYSQAFGLLEVLIVIAIIGILAGIAMPSLNRMVEDAYIKSKANELYSFLFYNRLAVNEGRFGWVRINRTYNSKWRSHEGYGDKVLFGYNREKINFIHVASSFEGAIAFPKPDGDLGFIFCPKDNDPERAYVVTYLMSGLVQRYKKGYKNSTEKLGSCNDYELSYLYFSLYGDDKEQIKEIMDNQKTNIEFLREYDEEAYGNKDDY